MHDKAASIIGLQGRLAGQSPFERFDSLAEISDKSAQGHGIIAA